MRILLVDGNHLASRCRHAQRDLRTAAGHRSGVVFGTLQGLSFVRNSLKLDLSQVWVVWDGGRAQARLDLYPDYKKRKKKELTPEEAAEDELEHHAYITQLEALREGLEHTGMRQVRVKGTEADDLVAIMARAFAADCGDVIVYSGDRDYHQLVDCVSIFDPKEELMERAEILALHGVKTPEDILLLKAIQGDPSDNITGVKGVGPVKAKLALPYVGAAFGDLDGADKKTLSAVNAVRNAKDIVQRNLKLMRLPRDWNDFPHYTDVQGGIFLDELSRRPKANKIKFVKFLRTWDCNSIIDHLERW